MFDTSLLFMLLLFVLGGWLPDPVGYVIIIVYVVVVCF